MCHSIANFVPTFYFKFRYMEKINLRFYARFRTDYGRLRAVINYNKSRKFLTTNIPISREQLSRFDSIGDIDITNTADMLLRGRIMAFKRHLMAIVEPMVELDTFADVAPLDLAKMIKNRFEEERERCRRRHFARLGINVDGEGGDNE